MPVAKAPRAAIIVIGDEILKGQVQDLNTKFLATELRECGVKLGRVLILPDDVDDISRSVREFSKDYDYVFTTGGVGPTHDDVTFEAVAKAFDDELEVNDAIKEVLEGHFKDNMNEATLKMAKVPSKANVDYSKTGKRTNPLIVIENVYIFPGIPNLLQMTFAPLKKELSAKHSMHKTVVEEVFVKETEFVITDTLNALVEKYKDSVTFGSYPEWTNNYYETKLTIETSDAKLCQQIIKEIGETMTTVPVVDKQPTKDAMSKIDGLLAKSKADPDFFKAVEFSKGIIQECFEKFRPEQVAIAFNGGKDCMVMLHLIHAHLEKQSTKLKALYIRDTNPFPEVEDFIANSAKMYNLDLITIDGPMKSALAALLVRHPEIEATVLGTRNGDPGSSYLTYFSPTDGDWPSVMRVSPILDWDYSYVWQFLRGLTLPYPIIYDRGYTSIGNTTNTISNPNLKDKGADGKVVYKPAYDLTDGSLERAGRNQKPGRN